MATAIANLTQALANPFVAFLLRAALGAYIIYMARSFYADPLGYFRRWMPGLPELTVARKTIRALACFCLWGGCFIIASAIAAQLLDLHGYVYACLLVLLAATVTYFLLPTPTEPRGPGRPSGGTRRAGRSGIRNNRPLE